MTSCPLKPLHLPGGSTLQFDTGQDLPGLQPQTGIENITCLLSAMQSATILPLKAYNICDLGTVSWQTCSATSDHAMQYGLTERNDLATPDWSKTPARCPRTVRPRCPAA